MTAHRYKAELYLFADDPDFWVWQYLESNGRWISTIAPPAHHSKVKVRLVPRPWLEEPGKWDVECQRKCDTPLKYWNKIIDPSWDHASYRYELRPRHRPLYQSRVEIPRAMTEEPKAGTLCYIPNVAYEIIQTVLWGKTDYQQRFLEAGFLYTTEADARARLDAMLKTEE